MHKTPFANPVTNKDQVEVKRNETIATGHSVHIAGSSSLQNIENRRKSLICNQSFSPVIFRRLEVAIVDLT